MSHSQIDPGEIYRKIDELHELHVFLSRWVAYVGDLKKTEPHTFETEEGADLATTLRYIGLSISDFDKLRMDMSVAVRLYDLFLMKREDI